MSLRVRERTAADDAWVTGTLRRSWGAPILVSRGRIHQGDALPALVAEREGAPVGLLCYEIREGQLEVVSLVALVRRTGVGRALLEAAREAAARAGCRRLWLVTTNDNLPAMGFYEHVGLRLAAVHHGAAARARSLKPEIPEIGIGGIRIEDEVEFEYVLPGPGPGAGPGGTPSATPSATPAGGPGAVAAPERPGPGGKMSEPAPGPSNWTALLAIGGAAAVELALFQWVLLPIVARRLTPAEIDRLGVAVRHHSWWLYAGVLGAGLLLAAPIWLVAGWIVRRRARSL